MNKRQKIVQEAFLDNEEAVIRRLKQVYNQSLKDITEKAKELQLDIEGLDRMMGLDIWDDSDKEKLQSMKQAKVYQKQYQDALRKQVGSILDNMQVEEFKTVSEYLNKCYEEGFLGTMYDLQGQGIPLCFPMDQEAMVRAVQLDSKISQGLYTRLGEDVTLLKKKITAQVSRGISTGMSFQQVAKGLSDYTNIGFNNAVRIARTEGHRIQVQSGMDACYKAKDMGADVVKQWDASLDKRTRESHARVDGEIKELDEPFSNGLMFPGDPDGGAAEVVNCRCALLQRARWALEGEFSKYDGFSKEIKQFENKEAYDNFKKDYYSKENVRYMKYVDEMQEKYQTKDWNKILAEMDDNEYKRFKALEKARPSFDGMYKGQDIVKIKATGYDAFKKEYKKVVNNIEKSKNSSTIEVAGNLQNYDRKSRVWTRNEDVKAVNPNHNKGAEYKQNCQRCVPAYELRRRGYDVTAKPARVTTSGNLSKKDILVQGNGWYNGIFDNIKWKMGNVGSGLNDIETAMQSFGDGARAEVYVRWKNGGAHVFVAEQVGDKTVFIDPQSGNEDVKHYFNDVKHGSTMFARIDNLKVKDLIEECVQNGR